MALTGDEDNDKVSIIRFLLGKFDQLLKRRDLSFRQLREIVNHQDCGSFVFLAEMNTGLGKAIEKFGQNRLRNLPFTFSKVYKN